MATPPSSIRQFGLEFYYRLPRTKSPHVVYRRYRQTMTVTGRTKRPLRYAAGPHFVRCICLPILNPETSQKDIAVWRLTIGETNRNLGEPVPLAYRHYAVPASRLTFLLAVLVTSGLEFIPCVTPALPRRQNSASANVHHPQ